MRDSATSVTLFRNAVVPLVGAQVPQRDTVADKGRAFMQSVNAHYYFYFILAIQT